MRRLGNILLQLGVVGLVVGFLFGVGALAFFASVFPEWTGFNSDALPPSSIPTPIIVYQQEKTLWDWLDLLLVPLVLAVGGFILTRQENRYALELQERREREAQRLEDQRITETRRIEEERTQDSTLQSYFDQMTSLLLDKNLRKSTQEDEVRSVARARTLTVLKLLDVDRKARVVQFLYEARLIDSTNDKAEVPSKSSIIVLEGANLEGTNLSLANLRGANLSGVHLEGVDLQWAYLAGANLQGAHLEGVDLAGADLQGADLRWAHLQGANLRWAHLDGADLQGANLEGADLHKASLGGTIFFFARLDGVKLENARLKKIQQKKMNYEIEVQRARNEEVMRDSKRRLSKLEANELLSELLQINIHEE